MTKVNAKQWLNAKLNRGRCWMLGAATAALVICGCAGPDGPSKSQRLDDFLHAPELLTSPVAVLLTNTPGFSARVNVTTQGKTKSGQLLGRENNLLFAQDPPTGSSKRHRYEQSSFIWNVAEGKGYVLNDPLQGYAPVSTTTKTTGAVSLVNSGLLEDVGGHHCKRVEKTVTLSDGSTAAYTVWEATDLKGFPVRIKSANGSFTFDFSKIQLENIPAGLFLLPDGFLKFSSPESMTSELMERELRMTNKGAGEWNRTPVDFRDGMNQRQNNPYGPE